MALPDSISGIVFAQNGGRHGPFNDGADTYFAAIDTDVAGLNTLEIWKNTNPGTSSWSTAASDAVTSGQIYSIDCVQVGTNLHILVGAYSGTLYYHYYVFSMSSDSFTTTEETAISISTGVPASSSIFGCLAVRSDGSVVAVIQDATEKLHGTDYDRVSYLKRSTGGTWDSSTTAVDDAGQTHYTTPRCVLGASDKVHIVYIDTITLQHKSLNSSDTLSSAEAVNDTSMADGNSRLAYVNDATEGEIIEVIWKKSSNGYLYSSLIDDDATPAAEAAVSTAAISAGDFTICGDDTNDKLYAIWVDSGDSDIDHCEYTPGTGWGSVTSTEATITATAIAGANVYTNDSSDTVLAYLYDESTNGESYNEYVLATGGTTLSPAAAVLNLVAQNPTLSETITPANAQLNLQAQNPVLAETIAPSAAIVNLQSSVGSVTQGVNVSPAAAQLNLQAANPTLATTITANAQLNLQAQNPTLVLGAYTPAAAILTLQATGVLNTSLSPAASVLNLQAINPTLATTITANATLNLQAQNPTLLLGGYTPDAAILNLQATSPTLSLALSPAAAILTLAATVGSVTQGISVSPAAAILNLQALLGSLVETLSPAAASLSLTANNPSLSSTLSPAEAILSLQAQNPILSEVIANITAILNLQASVGSVSQGISVSPAAAILSLQATLASLAGAISPGAASLNLQAQNPSLSTAITPSTAILNLQAQNPVLSEAITPGAAILNLQAQNPTLAIVITANLVATLNLQASIGNVVVGGSGTTLSPAAAILSLQAQNPALAHTVSPAVAILTLQASVGAVLLAYILQVDSDNILILPARQWVYSVESRDWVHTLDSRHWIYNEASRQWCLILPRRDWIHEAID